jgi:hypothetical protein
MPAAKFFIPKPTATTKRGDGVDSQNKWTPWRQTKEEDGTFEGEDAVLVDYLDYHRR